MAILRGIETKALGRKKTVEVAYEGKAYVDRSGKPVKLQDVTCYDCLNNYYVLADDPIEFCPHCGRREGGKTWANFEDARKWAMEYDFAWLRKLGVQPFGVRRGDGAWLLGIGKSPDAFLATGRFVDARPLQTDQGGWA